MEKSKLGIRLWVYAALAFVLAALGQTLLCGLLCGLAVVAEKNRWLNRQMIQAFALILASAAISTVLGLLNPINSIPFVGLVFSKIVSTVNSLIDLLVIVLAVVGILNVARGKDAGIPVLSLPRQLPLRLTPPHPLPRPTRSNNFSVTQQKRFRSREGNGSIFLSR